MAFKFDYYLVDEVTAVGDARFKQKCADLFNSRHKEASFLMVSHSLNSLKEYCDIAVLATKDRNIQICDNVNDAISQYLLDESK